MTGIGKRPADYVPRKYRSELDKLSKADLMEIAFDYAMRTVGEDEGPDRAYDDLRDTARILTGPNRKPIKLRSAAAL